MYFLSSMRGDFQLSSANVPLNEPLNVPFNADLNEIPTWRGLLWENALEIKGAFSYSYSSAIEINSALWQVIWYFCYELVWQLCLWIQNCRWIPNFCVGQGENTLIAHTTKVQIFCIFSLIFLSIMHFFVIDCQKLVSVKFKI